MGLTTRSRVVALLAATMMLVAGVPTWPCAATGPQASPAGTPIVNMDLIRNGTFDQNKTAWATNAIGTGVGAGYGLSGPGMQIWTEFSDNYGYIFQEVHPPTQTGVAGLSFDYRIIPGSGAALGWFRARLTTSTSTIATLLEITPANYPGEAWQATGSLSLDAGELAALNSARAAGEHIFLILELWAQFLYVNVDNVSCRVSGEMTYPFLGGSIAYVGVDASGNLKTIRRMDPSGGNEQTLWTHPGTVPETNAIQDVAWKPDGRELAFSSNHETLYSAFQSDVYGIQPDGTGLRRITNPPSKAELDAGGYQTGSVTGSVYNNYGHATLFFLYIEGARDVVSLDVGGFGSQTGFTIPNVADLGAGSNYVVFTWASGDQANCKEYPAAVVNVIPGQTVDAGTLNFSGQCGTYSSDSISWKRDGSQVAVDVIVPRRFNAGGEAFGQELFDAPLTADEVAWSPVNDQVLYRNWLVGGGGGIFLTTAGGSAGMRLVDDMGALWTTPAWLPDGSGFIYTMDDTLHQVHVSTGQDTLLVQFYNEYVFNPSPSPDGNYVVFERQSTAAPIQRDLWIMNRNQPAEMWPLTADGRSSDPDWSRVNPPTTVSVYLPLQLRRR